MKARKKITIRIMSLLLVLTCGRSAFAVERQYPLLSELVASPRTVVASREKTGSHDRIRELANMSSPDNDDASSEAPDIFTLNELRENRAAVEELELPDVDLPSADIPLALNEKVEYFIYYFQTRGRQSFTRWLSRSSRYIPMMKNILKNEGMPEDLVYLAMIESGFHMNAKSWANAVGPWQFISGTGRRYSLRIDQWIDERKDPVKATTAAALYLKELYSIFNGDWYLAAAGYNAGENKILKAIDIYNTNDFWEISKGSFLKRETREYVPKLLAAAIIAKNPERYGFIDIAYLPPIEFDTVKITSRTDLELAAKLADTTYDVIRELNPELRHWCTPPNYPDYELKIPKGAKGRFEDEYLKIPTEKRYTEKNLYTRYRVKKRESLASVARRFGISASSLASLNGIPLKSRVTGKTLVVPVRQTVHFSSEGRNRQNDDMKNPNRYYTVRKGDTLFAISRRFSVPVKLLAVWNNLKTNMLLKPGSRIVVAKADRKSGKRSSAKS